MDFENTYANELNEICERCSPTSFNKSEILEEEHEDIL